MDLIIHDLNTTYDDLLKNNNNSILVLSNTSPIKHCIGCFSCFSKTPGQCILKDNFNNLGSILGNTTNLIIISKCIYGTYSPFIRNILDRSLSYIHPDFTKRNGEIHHKVRYSNSIKVSIYFYGKVSEPEKQTAKKLVLANLVNFNASLEKIEFFENVEDLFNENCFNHS